MNWTQLERDRETQKEPRKCNWSSTTFEPYSTLSLGLDLPLPARGVILPVILMFWSPRTQQQMIKQEEGCQTILLRRKRPDSPNPLLSHFRLCPLALLPLHSVTFYAGTPSLSIGPSAYLT